MKDSNDLEKGVAKNYIDINKKYCSDVVSSDHKSEQFSQVEYLLGKYFHNELTPSEQSKLRYLLAIQTIRGCVSSLKHFDHLSNKESPSMQSFWLLNPNTPIEKLIEYGLSFVGAYHFLLMPIKSLEVIRSNLVIAISKIDDFKSSQNFGQNLTDINLLLEQIESDINSLISTMEGLSTSLLGPYSSDLSSDYRIMLKACDKIIKLNPNDANGWKNRGSVCRALGSYDDALQALNRAIELDPHYVDAWQEKGLVLSKLGKYDSALHAFDKAIELDSSNAIAWYRKGVILKIIGRDVEADSAISQAKVLGYKE